MRGKSVAFVADGLPIEAVDAARCIVDGVVIGGYRFDRYKTRNPNELPKPEKLDGRAFYILHSPQDFIPMRFPQSACDVLKTTTGVLRSAGSFFT